MERKDETTFLVKLNEADFLRTFKLAYLETKNFDEAYEIVKAKIMQQLRRR